MFAKCFAWIVIVVTFLYGIVSFFSTLESGYNYFERRGAIMRIIGEILLSRWTSLALFLGGVGFLYYLQWGIPEWIYRKKDLEVSILNFGYDQITQELVSDVEFRNNGSGRRTVVRVNFVYNKPEFGSSEVYHRQTRRLLPSNEPTRPSDPIYVEPNLPVVITYRHPIEKEVVNWPDSIFGLEITTVGKDGLGAITKIDVMFVPDVPNRGYSISGLKRFSLDLPPEKRKSPLR